MVTLADKRRDEAERLERVLALGRTSCPSCRAPYVRPRFRRPYFICIGCGFRWSENPVIDALGSWLTELHQRYPWDWFATLTFARKEITADGAQYWFRRYLEETGKAGACAPYAFRADEYGPLHGRYHLHALIGNVSHSEIYCGQRLKPGTWGENCCAVHRWQCGIARIYPYDPKRGANYYLSKYVTKALATWDLVGFESQDLIFRKDAVRNR